MKRIFVEITKEAQNYVGLMHQGHRRMAHHLTNLNLDSDAEITIKTKTYRLGDLVQAMLDYKQADLAIAYDERGQLEIGQFLARQIFQQFPPEEFKSPTDEPIDLRIVTDDEDIARLPWVLLNHRGNFLSANNWAISLSRKVELNDCEFPENPRLLILAPEPEGYPKTRAGSHLEALECKLALFFHRFSRGDLIRFAKNWEDFCAESQKFKPHLVYYYGHGEGDAYITRLVFAAKGTNQPLRKPIADFAQVLRNLPEAPKIVYLNCCSGDAGGFLGAGWQLGAFVPAVITNRTIAFVDAAQQQAQAFWESVLLNGQPPHVAMHEIRGKLIDQNLSFSDARWMTPVLHSHYADWKAKPPQRVNPLEKDPHWHLKLDRVQQFYVVGGLTRQMLRERRPQSFAFVWYGRKGEGVDIFHKRLRVELLQEDISTSAHFHEVRPTWPMEFHEVESSFEQMLCEAFDVQQLTGIPRCLRKITGGESGRQLLVYVCHQPVDSPKLINPGRLKEYLNWWDQKFIPLLQSHCYCLLTVSFIVNNPPRFRKMITEKSGIYDLRFSKTVFKLLDEMETVGKNDLLDFLQTHNIPFPGKRKNEIIQKILEETKGHYDLTINALKQYVRRAWDETESKVNTEEVASDNWDY